MTEENTQKPAEEQVPPADASGEAAAPPAEAPAEASAAAAVAPAAAPAEPEPTSTPRRTRRWLVWSLVLLAIAVLGAGGYIGYRALTARSAADSKLAEATQLVEAADQVVLDTDDIVRSEIDATAGEAASQLATDVPDAAADLDRAMGLIDEALSDLAEDDQPRARALRASASARLEMLEVSLPILQATTKAGAAIGPATEAWTIMLDAEKLSDQAVAEYNKLNKDGVENAKKLSKQAKDKLNAAKAQLKIVTTAFPEADMQPFIDYADAKIASIDISIKADDAYLAGKMSDANSYSDKFNDSEKKLATRAGKLPGPPAAVVASAYETLTSAETDAYFIARDAATAADADLKAITD